MAPPSDRADQAASAPSAELSWVPVRGDSMWPVLRSGDIAGFCAPAQATRCGDVVVARINGRLLVHRVVRFEDARLVLRGDANTREDPPTDSASILGRVHLVRRGARVLDPSAWDRPAGKLARQLRGIARRVGARGASQS